ncbi:DoxX family membrane protein [Moorella sulfitireducens]|uniref:DoxX family membrane protein n=1 Tax=Neomoorella sulfitireducens TaxID=2972948 RepID=UPI0021AD1954|nr:DoxX family membrane protein [Moorella sulfitireducens]
MLDLLRDRRFSIVWTILRVWLGWQWLEAGLHKVSDPRWMQTGEALKGYWAKAAGILPGSTPAIKYGWYEAFIRSLHDGGHYTWFAKLVVFGEILTGIALILGVLTVFALFIGAFMNLNFMLAGSASTNPVLYTVAIILLLAGSSAYYYGVDRVILPYLQRRKETREPVVES